MKLCRVQKASKLLTSRRLKIARMLEKPGVAGFFFASFSDEKFLVPNALHFKSSYQ